MGTTLTAAEARRAALHAQGLLGAPRSRTVPALLRKLGAVQLDTISVLARSQELVPFARLGAVGRPAVHQAFWEPRGPGSARTFEYWAHAACVLPAEDWPLFSFRRKSYRNRNDMWGMTPQSQSVRDVLSRLAIDGPLTTNDLGGARKTPGWWDWSEVKQAVEYLLARGEVVCVERRGWRRVYDLPERALPAESLHDELTDRQCHVELVTRAGRALGVATRADLLDYYRLTADGRLLFGGGANYSGRDSRDIAGELRPCIERTFPALKGLEMPWMANSLAMTRVSSAAMASQALSASRARSEMSRALPMGVARI